MSHRHPRLIRVEIAQLHPTQISVGLAEVADKRAAWQQLSPARRRDSLAEHWFPAVRGPGGTLYITDHHHLGRALHEEGVTQGWAMIQADLSWLSPETFWRTLEFRQWAHPYDEQGRRQDCRHIPDHVAALRDDPYRSLAGFVRHAGGYAKEALPFAEFLWADYFRPQFSARDIHGQREMTVAAALALARLPQARYLPGWCGEHEGSAHEPG